MSAGIEATPGGVIPFSPTEQNRPLGRSMTHLAGRIMDQTIAYTKEFTGGEIARRSLEYDGPRLAVPLIGEDAANSSYAWRLDTAGLQTGVFADVIEYTSAGELVNDMPRLNELYNGVLPMLPVPKPEGGTDWDAEMMILEAMDPNRDPDRLIRPDELQATAESMLLVGQELVGHPLGELETGDVLIIGKGDRTTSRHKGWFADRGIEVQYLENRKQIEAGLDGGEARGKKLLIAAARAGHIIRARHISPGTKITDAGFGKIADKNQIPGRWKKFGSNTHPEVHGVEGVEANSFFEAVGLVTAALAIQRVAEQHQLDRAA